jgi:hypothetical protein
LYTLILSNPTSWLWSPWRRSKLRSSAMP